MREELTCWDALKHRGFTGLEAALAIVGEPQTEAPEKLLKASPVLEQMRHDYERTCDWLATPPAEQKAQRPPEVLLMSEAMQEVMDGNLVKRDAVADHPYCEWSRLTEQVSILFAGEVQRKVSALGHPAWLMSRLADFDRQTFARDVLARWVQQVGATSLYPFSETLNGPEVTGARTHQAVVPERVDFTQLATREELIAAFGSFTGMKEDWFKNLKDKPALLAARKVAGQGGRGHLMEPLFCPFAVMEWLVNPKRRVGRKLSANKAWELLERHFPKVHATYSVCDPRTTD